jgi:hypothetical protein
MIQDAADVYVPNTSFRIDGPHANQKQVKFLEAITSDEYQFMAYGGAIRGGKSFVVLFAIHCLCMTFPGSRWAVIRVSLPVLKKTTIPSFNKLIKTRLYGKWNHSDHIFTYHNGSQIIFMPESISQDPQLNNFLGLEVNGFFLEQAEELSQLMWEKALERTGSWYLDKMPKGFIFLTFNPTQNWVKKLFYEPWKDGRLEENFYFLEAKADDNHDVTEDQWKQWGKMAERYRLQFVSGDWTDFADKNNLWAFAFERSKHVCKAEDFPELDRSQLLYLSFDFNRNPICCSVIQHIDGVVYVHETIKLGNSDIYALCDYILTKYQDYMYMITGDASGKNSSALVQDGLNYYTVIRQKLVVGDAQLSIPLANPSLAENQVLVNSLLSNYSIQIHEDAAAHLIYDLANVRMNADGTIVKANREDPTQQADALDTFRYWCNMFMGDFLRMG